MTGRAHAGGHTSRPALADEHVERVDHHVEQHEPDAGQYDAFERAPEKRHASRQDEHQRHDPWRVGHVAQEHPTADADQQWVYGHDQRYEPRWRHAQRDEPRRSQSCVCQESQQEQGCDLRARQLDPTPGQRQESGQND
jgi:hypothetical protein